MQQDKFDRFFKIVLVSLLIVFIFLFYRYSENKIDSGRYQFFYNADRGGLFLTDTKTGEIYMGSSISGSDMVWVKLNPKTAEHLLVTKPTP